MKKHQIISIIITALILIAIPISVVSFGFLLPSQFDETYYGELPYMFNRLKESKNNKIINAVRIAASVPSKTTL